MSQHALLIFIAVVCLWMTWIWWQNRYQREGNRLFALKDYDGAIVAFEKSLKILGPHLLGFSNLSSALSNAKRYEESLQVLDQAVELGLVKSLDDADALGFVERIYLNNRAVAMLKLHRYEESLDCLEIALRHTEEKTVEYLLMLINYGRVYAEQRHVDAALEVLKRVNEWIDTHGFPANNRAEYEELLNNFRSAIGHVPDALL